MAQNELTLRKCTSYITLCSIAVLLVHLTFHQNTPDYHTIELVVDKAMKGHEQLCHDSESQAQRVLKVHLSLTTVFCSMLTTDQESRNIATAARQARMSMDLSTGMGTVPAHPFDVQQLGFLGSTADQSFPMLNEYEHSAINPEFQNEFFKELRWGGSVADGAGLDIIMNVGFDEY